MRTTNTISRMLNQKIEHINPEELGKYQIESEIGICRKVASGEWNDEEGDAEILRIRGEIKQITAAYSSSQYTWYREMYHHHAQSELGLSFMRELSISYEMIMHLLEKCINYRTLFLSGPPNSDEVIPIYQEMLSEYQQKRKDILSSEFWKEHHQPAEEVQS